MSKKLTLQDIQQLAHSRGHSIVNPLLFEKSYKSVKSIIEIYCSKCNTVFKTSVASYKNAKQTGCSTCKNRKASETHSNKIVSSKTRILIGTKASLRPGSLKGKSGEQHPRFQNAPGRDIRKRSTEDYYWINGIKKLYARRCVLSKTTEQLVCHHLDAWNLFPEKRYDITNGVLLAKEVHKKFHACYGYGNNTEFQFSEFCERFYDVNWSDLKKEVFRR